MPDCLVIGGGIIGLSLAYELSSHHLSVQVLEGPRGRRPASWAAAGILPPPIKYHRSDPLEQLRFLSQELYPSWCARLGDETRIDLGFHRCGGLYLSRQPGESVALRATVQQWRAGAVRVETVLPGDVVRLEPALAMSENVGCVYRLPDEAQVRPSRLLKALRKCLLGRGVQIREDVTVAGWFTGRSGRAGLETNQGRLMPDWICVAAGPWSAGMLGGLGIDLAVEPRRGQMVAWQTPRPLIQHVINEGPRYLLSRDDGWLLAGSTVEDVGFDDTTTAQGIDELTSFAHQWIPALRNQPVRKRWAGLRPYARDGLPHLGCLARWHNVVVAAGHFRSGIHLAPATARVLGQLVRGEVPQVDLLPLAPARS